MCQRHFQADIQDKMNGEILVFTWSHGEYSRSKKDSCSATQEIPCLLY
jgi:hypothetical protein